MYMAEQLPLASDFATVAEVGNDGFVHLLDTLKRTVAVTHHVLMKEVRIGGEEHFSC